MSSSEVLYLRSSKKKSMSNGGDTSTNDDDDDVWDDTLLIEAYDKAVNLAHNEVLKNMQSSLNKGKDISNKGTRKVEWRVGDHCRCEYGEDHEYYEAKIIDIIDDVGMCIVKYLGYENEEKIPLYKLKPSKGEMYQKMQIKQALQDNNVVEDGSMGKDSDADGRSRSQKKKSNGKRGKVKSKDSGFSANEINFSCHQNLPSVHMTIPPPPPPHLFSNFREDVSESEAMSAMLMAWYMSGYHTGYYQGLKTLRKK